VHIVEALNNPSDLTGSPDLLRRFTPMLCHRMAGVISVWQGNPIGSWQLMNGEL
jgi:hypothetical protein